MPEINENFTYQKSIDKVEFVILFMHKMLNRLFVVVLKYADIYYILSLILF
jgi:hypothetical protein